MPTEPGPEDAASEGGSVARAASTTRSKVLAAERYSTWVRLGIVLFSIGLFVPVADEPTTVLWLAYAIAAVALAYTAVIYAAWRRNPATWLMDSPAIIGTYTVLIGAAILATGGLASPYHLVYFVGVISIALRYSFRETITSAVAFVVTYVGVIYAMDQLAGNALVVLARTGYIVLAAVVGGILANESLRQARGFSRMAELADRLDEEVRLRSEALAASKRAHLQLHRREAEYRLLAENASDVIVRADRDGTLAYVSPASRAVLGYRPDELVSKRFQDLVHPDDDEAVGFDAGAPNTTTSTCRMRTHAGTDVWVEASWHAVADPESGEVREFVGVLRDVTERRHVEEQLRFQSTLLASQNEASPDGILIVDREGRVVSYNDRFIEIWGLDRDTVDIGRADVETIGRAMDVVVEGPAFLDTVHALDRDPDATVRDEVALADGRVLERWSTPVVSTDGHRYGRGWYFRDITDRKQAEERFRRLVEAAPDALVIVDEQGDVQLLNSQAERLFGYGRDELVGRPVEVLVPEGLRADHVEHRHTYAADARPRPMGLGLELEAQHRDGSLIPVEISLSPLRSDDRRLVMAAVRDVTEKREAQQALQRERDLLQSTMATSPAGIVLVGADGRVLFANARAEAVLGLDAGGLAGRHHADPGVRAVDEDGQPTQDEVLPLGAVIDGPAPVRNVERTIERPDGERVLLSINGAPVLDDAGEPASAVFTLEDITQRRAAQEARALLASIVESSDDAIVAEDVDGRILSWNHGAERIFGYTADEAVGRHFSFLVPDQAADDVARIEAHVREGAPIENHETVRRRRDGSLIHVSITQSPLFDADGNVAGAAAIARDITERKIAQYQIHSANERVRNILESIEDAFVALDSDWRYTYINNKTVELAGEGFKAEALVGQRIWDAYPDLVGTEAETQLRRAMEQRVPVVYEEHDEGSDEWYEVRAFPAEEGLSIFFHDITQRKRTQRELEHNVRRLRELNAELDAFTYTASHDLAEPLRTMSAFSEIVLEEHGDVLPEQGREDLSRVVRAARRMQALLEGLTLLSRVGRAQTSPDTHELAPLVEAIREDLTAIRDETGTVVELATPDATVYADRTQLMQALSNLVRNGIRHNESDKPRVVVRAAPHEDGVLVTVEDNGVGVPEDSVERIFELFDKGSAPRDAGAGAGLAIVRKIMERHGGRAWVEPREGGGSSFHLYFPGPGSGEKP